MQKQRRVGLGWVVLCVAVLAALGGKSAQAQSCSLARSGAFVFGPLTADMPRDSSAGRSIASATLSYVMSCTGLTVGRQVAVKFRPNLRNCPIGSNPNYLSTISIPSIGLSFRNTPVPPGGTGSSNICTTSATTANGRFFDVLLATATVPSQTFHFSLSAEVVKIDGPLQTGTATFADTIGNLDWVQLGGTGDRPFPGQSGQVSASMVVAVRSQTCRTGNVEVDLGVVSAASLNAAGAQVAPWRAFAIPVNDCPAGFARIRYQLGNVSPFLNGTRLLSPGSASDSAGGVGIQLADEAGQALPYGQWQLAGGYDAVRTNGGSFNIALRARYVKPASTGVVTPGKVNAQVVFTMAYE